MSLTPQLFQRVYPATYLSKFVHEHVRPDGRALDETRPVQVHRACLAHTLASALVRLGRTTVVCGLTIETAPTAVNAPACGFLIPGVNMSPACSGNVAPGPPSDRAQALTHELARILDCIVKHEELVIAPGRMAFALYVDVEVLNDDGNLSDAVLLSVLASLQDLVLPGVTFDPESGRVDLTGEEDARDATSGSESSDLAPTTTQPRRLTVAKVTPLTVALFENTLLPDPSAFEEELYTAKLSLVATSKGIVYLHQTGITVDHQQTLEKCLELCRVRGKELARVI